MPSKTVTLPPTIDEHARTYELLRAALDDCKRQLEEKKAEILKLVARNGQVPDGAAKSLRLEGDEFTITASFGTTSSVDADIVAIIQAQLAADRQPGMFKKLFKTHTSYLVNPQAPAVLKACSTAVSKLFGRVVKTKPKEPSLKVERRKK